MSKVTTFTRPVVKNLREAIKNALSNVEAEYDITLDFNSISFRDDQFSTRLVARVGGDTSEHAKKDWDANCALFGFKPEDFGKTCIIQGQKFTISGIKPRSRKYPILGTDVNGKTYKLPTTISVN
jgi:hypothetical protein